MTCRSRLHVIQSRPNLVFLVTAMSSSLHRIIVATTSFHRQHTTARTGQPYHHHTMRVNLAILIPTGPRPPIALKQESL